MAQNAFQHAGANAGKQTRYADLWTARYFTGLYTNRSFFGDGGSRVEGLYLGPRGDALTAESLNVEVSTRLTLIRRPGLSIWNDKEWDSPNIFYEFRRFLASEVISVLVDQPDGLYDGTNNQKNLIWSKLPGAGQSYMQSVGNTLYWGDGVSQKKWLAPRSWDANTAITPGTLINQGAAPGVVYMALGGITMQIVASQIFGAHITLYVNPSDVPANFTDLIGAEVTFSGLTNAAVLNGTTVPVTQIVSTTLGAFSVFHFTGSNHPLVADNGVATTGSGTTGATVPTFTPTEFTVTQDSGQQWKSYGTAVENWGVVPPAAAPTLAYVGSYFVRFWQPYGGIPTNYSILDNNGNVEYNTTGSLQASGRVYPTWSGVGGTTIDGDVTWLNVGPPGEWLATTVFGSGTSATVNVILDSNGNWQYAINNGTTGATPPVWNTTVGTNTADSGVTWKCLGPGTIITTATISYAFSYHAVDGTVSEASPQITIPGGSVGSIGTQGYFVQLGGPLSADPQVDQIWIWRTQQGGATLFFEDAVPADGSVVSWVYLDPGIPDTSVMGGGALNILIEAPIDGSSDPPPNGLVNLTYHLGRIFGSVANVVYWSSGPDITTGNGNTGFRPANVAVFPAPVYRMVALSTGLFVFTNSDIYIIYGLATTSSPLTPLPFALGTGLGSYNALDVNGGVIYFFTTDGQIVSLDPNNGLSEVGFPIGDQFQSAPWSPQTSYLAWYIGGTRDKALFVSDGQGDWFRMCATPSPETGLTWSPKATVAGGAKAMASIETAPGVHQLLVGPSGTGPILFRDWNTNTDNGQVYPAYFTIGSLVLAHPGQVAELAYFTFDSIKVGKPLMPSVRIDEISGPFEEMPRFTPDPPQLVASRTLYSHRHYFSQTEQPAICRHLQLKISWEAENVANELMSSTLFGGFLQER